MAALGLYYRHSLKWTDLECLHFIELLQDKEELIDSRFFSKLMLEGEHISSTNVAHRKANNTKL